MTYATYFLLRIPKGIINYEVNELHPLLIIIKSGCNSLTLYLLLVYHNEFCNPPLPAPLSLLALPVTPQHLDLAI